VSEGNAPANQRKRKGIKKKNLKKRGGGELVSVITIEDTYIVWERFPRGGSDAKASKGGLRAPGGEGEP